MDSIVWLILMIGFLLVEACTVSLVSLWFVIGALAALLVSLLTAPIWLQITVFILVSAILLLLLRPIATKYLIPKITHTNADAVVGTTGYVTAAIDNVEAVGQVKLGGKFWTARSSSGEIIAERTLVRVDRIEGVKVFVSPAEVPVNAQ